MKQGTGSPLRVIRVLVASSILLGSVASAAVTEQEAAQLGRNLTPVGAEKAGNKEGTIPEWTGGAMTAPSGWKVGQKRIDPFAADKVLFSIDASNVDKYKDKLSEGQVALVKRLKGYRMDVYPTRRSCGFPDFVYERTKVNAREARLASNGWGLEKGIGAAVLFPDPEDRRRGGVEPQGALHGRGEDRALRDDLLEQGRQLHAPRAGPVDVGAVPFAEEQGRGGRGRRGDEAAQRSAVALGARR